MKLPNNMKMTDMRVEGGQAVVDLEVNVEPLRTLGWTEYRGPELECCWLPHPAARDFFALPGLSEGDKRAWMDRNGCPNKATWRIYWEGDPYETTDSCDGHKAELMDDGDVAYPIATSTAAIV